MDFGKMFKMQAELDQYIGKSKKIKMEDYKLERVLAFQVEFNELLNEVPFLFKYWSNKKMNRDRALEEFVDGLHFLLSIGNDLGINEYEYTRPEREWDMRRIAQGINVMIPLINKRNYKRLFDLYLWFGEKLGFSFDDIEKKYMEKNEVNYQRQDQGY